MKSLDKIVDFYLNTETQNALMITGDWGAGKTFYFKNRIKPEISNTPVPNNNQKNYKPILLSLFGLKSIEDIQTEIFLNLYPFLKNPKVKLASNVIKVLAKGIIQLTGLGEYKEIASNLNIDKSTFIDFSELVICFDDLERRSPNLILDDLIGYINTLVELGTKIVVIANEQKIQDKNYIVLKEKLIGSTVEFTPDVSDTFDNIIFSKYDGKYRDFLMEKKDLILNILLRDLPNFRTLAFALNYFQLIFSEIKNKLFLEKVLFPNESEILNNLLEFSLAISIEYKNGEISFKNKRRIDDSTTVFIREFMKNSYGNNGENNENINEDSYAEEFIHRYYGSKEFNFYNSVYSFITGGAIFEFDVLVNELKNLYNLNDSLSPEYIVYNKLCYPTCFKLEDDSYLTLTQELHKYAIAGSYYLEDYLTAFDFIMRFGNPLDINPTLLVENIISGIKANISNYTYHHIQDHLRISNDSIFKTEKENLKIAILNFNKSLLIKEQSISAKKLETKCYINFNDFLNAVYKNEELRYKPFLSHFDYNLFFDFFVKSTNEVRWEITKFFMARYNVGDRLKEEYDFIAGIKSLIDMEIEKLVPNNISWFVFDDFAKQLDKILKQFQSLSTN